MELMKRGLDDKVDMIEDSQTHMLRYFMLTSYEVHTNTRMRAGRHKKFPSSLRNWNLISQLLLRNCCLGADNIQRRIQQIKLSNL